MSRVFWAVNRDTGERWKPTGDDHQYLVMLDSGCLAEVTEMPHEGDYVDPLDTAVWEMRTKWDTKKPLA